jgi:tRNA A-37 threonylcarbamoyl transferase component Bud32
MLFDPESLQNKMHFLDAVTFMPGLADNVVARHLLRPFQVVRLPRVWEPGGGATLFRIDSTQGAFLLKVKHRTVWVESRLECEPDYIRKPSLENEYEFLRIMAGAWAPQVLFFDEQDAFQFLAVEWLESFDLAISKMAAPALLDVWEGIVDAVQKLYERGIVHTDIHEHNICFRNGRPVLCDFEEARYLRQEVPFEESLDFAGFNKYGNVGEFPLRIGVSPGATC